jgi:hypothetical protein
MTNLIHVSIDNMGLFPLHVQSDNNPNATSRITLILPVLCHWLSPDVAAILEIIMAYRNLAEVEGSTNSLHGYICRISPHREAPRAALKVDALSMDFRLGSRQMFPRSRCRHGSLR